LKSILGISERTMHEWTWGEALSCNFRFSSFQEVLEQCVVDRRWSLCYVFKIWTI